MALRSALLALVFVLPVSTTTSLAAAVDDNAVIIRVTKVSLPDNLPGLCQVKGVISEVLDGKGFREGQQISLQVPCGTYQRPMPLLPAVETHSAQLADPHVLLGTKLGGAHIDDAGKLIWVPTRAYGHWGPVWGFRAFDGVPLSQHAEKA